MSASVLKNSVKREGQCAIRSANGMPILDETYSFIVVCTNKDEEYTSVLNATGLPYVGVTVSPSGYGVCKTKSGTRRTDNPLYWDVVCQFSSEVDERQSGQDPTTDPNVWVPIYETKFERLQEVVTKDLNDRPVANSAGQVFPVGLSIGRHIPVWEFFQFESLTGPESDETIIDRNETINEGSFKNRDPETLLLTVMSSVVGFYYGQRRRLTQYSLKYNERKWTHKRLDTGTYYVDGSIVGPTGQLRKFPYEDDGTPARVINGPLNGSGNKATSSWPDVPEPAILSFDIYPKISFSFLRV